VLRDPKGFAHGLRHPGGGDWDVGGRIWKRNPRHLVPRAIMRVVMLWDLCRAGMGGFAMLPEAGGINDQPAWLMAAFGVLNAENGRLEEIDRERRA